MKREDLTAGIAEHEAAIEALRQQLEDEDPTQRYRKALEAIAGTLPQLSEIDDVHAWIEVQRRMRMIANHALEPSRETAAEFKAATGD